MNIEMSKLNTWKEVFKRADAVSPQSYKQIYSYLQSLSKTCNIVPTVDKILTPFTKTSLEDVKVVFLGFTPYHLLMHSGPLANGMCFSTDKTTYCPSSLKAIMISVIRSLKDPFLVNMLEKADGELWGDVIAQQGALLLNLIPTCVHRDKKAHIDLWRTYSKNLIREISREKKDILWVVLGEKKMLPEIALLKDLGANILSFPTPGSSDKFLESNFFQKVQDKLISLGHTPLTF